MSAVWTLNERPERSVSTLQQLLAHWKGVMGAIRTLWERCVDAEGTLWERCVDDKGTLSGRFENAVNLRQT